MIYCVLFFLVFLPAGLSQTVVPASFPQCANNCLAKFSTNTSVGNCATTDALCICADTNFQSSWTCCLNTSCDGADLASAIGTMKEQCPTSPNIGTCAAGNFPTGTSPSGGFGGKGGGGGGAAPSSDTLTVTAAAPAPVTVTSPVTIQNSVTVTNTVPVTNSAIITATLQDSVTVTNTVPVTSPATTTATLLQTSVLTSSEVVVVTSTVSNVAESSAAPSTPLVTSTSLVEQTSLSSIGNVETMDTFSQSTSTAVSFSTTFYSPTINPTASPPAPVLSPTDTTRPSQPMSNSAKAGIAIAVLINVALLAVGIFFFMRWRKRAIDKEFRELKKQHYVTQQRPELGAVPQYPRVETTVSSGVAKYRDIFDKSKNQR